MRNEKSLAAAPVEHLPAIPLQQAHRLCEKCGTYKLHRQPRTLLHHLFSVSVYVCGHCKIRKTRFRFSRGTVVILIVLLAVGGGAAWLSMRPAAGAASEQDQLNAADALARARLSGGGLSTFEQMILRKPRGTLDNATIIRLWRANVGIDVILQLIRTSNPDYDVSANAIIELKQAGVDEKIILAMIDAPFNAR